MLQSGIKAPMAIRVYGDNLDGLAEAARNVAERPAARFRRSMQPRSIRTSCSACPTSSSRWIARAAARFGMTTMSVNQIIETALGGMNLTQTVEGRERYPIRIRYQRDLRERIDDLPRLPVVTETGEVVPLEVLDQNENDLGTRHDQQRGCPAGRPRCLCPLRHGR